MRRIRRTRCPTRAKVIKELGLDSDSLVIEVASNDGYLLKQIAELGVSVLGVEPAGNVAEIASRDGVSTVNAFFGRETAAALVESHGHPRLVVANNVMAHVPGPGRLRRWIRDAVRSRHRHYG